MRNRGYFLKPKGVRKQKCLGNTVLDEIENQDVLAPKISRKHENVCTADATYCTYYYEGDLKAQHVLHFVDSASRYDSWKTTNLKYNFFLCIYFNSLHVL